MYLNEFPCCTLCWISVFHLEIRYRHVVSNNIYNNAFTKVVEGCIYSIYNYICLLGCRELWSARGLGSRLAWRCRNIRWKLSLHNILFKKLHFPCTRVENENFEEIVYFPQSNNLLELLIHIGVLYCLEHPPITSYCVSKAENISWSLFLTPNSLPIFWNTLYNKQYCYWTDVCAVLYLNLYDLNTQVIYILYFTIFCKIYDVMSKQLIGERHYSFRKFQNILEVAPQCYHTLWYQNPKPIHVKIAT